MDEADRAPARGPGVAPRGAGRAYLLVAHPAWDFVANVIDARRSGGVAADPSQAHNPAASTVVAVAVAVALGWGLHAVLAVFGVRAILSGLLQFATGLRRWSAGAQWAMALSGAQSTLAGTHLPGIAHIAPYTAFGAFSSLISTEWLTDAQARKEARARAARSCAAQAVRPHLGIRISGFSQRISRAAESPRASPDGRCGSSPLSDIGATSGRTAGATASRCRQIAAPHEIDGPSPP